MALPSLYIVIGEKGVPQCYIMKHAVYSALYSTAYCSQPNGMTELCNHTLLVMLRVVVSKQQDDWNDQLPALLNMYRSTPHSSNGIRPYCMVYGVEMTMPLDLVIGDVGQEWPNGHYPAENDYSDRSEMLMP